MKKIFTLAVLALMGINASAQEVTLDFTSNDTWNFPAGSSNKLVATNSYSNGTYTIKLTASDGQGYYYNSQKYLMLGKKDATLELPAFDFDVEQIDVICTAGTSGNAKENIFVDGEAVSDEVLSQGSQIFKIADSKQSAGTIYTLKVTTNYNIQIQYIKIWKKGTAQEETIPEVNDINAFTALGNASKGTLVLTNCKVTYVSPDGKTVYVRDNTGGMCFYNQTAFTGATNKWQLGGKITGSVSMRNNMTQMNVSDASEMTHTDGEEYQPVEITLANIGDHVADLVKITDKITVVEDNSKFYNNAEKDLQIYDNFKLNYTIKAGDVIENLTGVIILYNSQKEIAPTVTPSITTGISSVKAAAEFNGAIYNIAGQKVSASYKGLVIKNGKKIVQK